jgi:phage baseplate assembly protein W
MAIILRRDKQTPVSSQEEYFSDFLTDFDIHPIKKDLVRYTNEDAVKRSIKNLLLTNRGDRPFNNTLGSDLRSMLFEQATDSTSSTLEDLIRSTIDDYEPRAKVEDVSVDIDEDTNTMYATIVFSIINKQEPITLEIILDRIR